MQKQNEQCPLTLQQLEERFYHTDLEHPAIRVLFEYQRTQLQPPVAE